VEVLTRAPGGGLIVVALLALLVGRAVSAPLTEAQVRAGLLYNFAAFVEWPDDDAIASRPFIIGVLGADAVGDALREIQGRPVKGRRLEVRRITRDADGRLCHILYIPAGADNWQTIVADVKGAPVLTIGEHAQFTALGGVIRLYAEDSRLRFEINVTRAQQSHLQISSKLLGLAKIVRAP
jgi:hypothetical protein